MRVPSDGVQQRGFGFRTRGVAFRRAQRVLQRLQRVRKASSSARRQQRGCACAPLPRVQRAVCTQRSSAEGAQRAWGA
jgi:hypothetical protein